MFAALLRRSARRPLTSASVPAALAVLLAAQRYYASRRRRIRARSGSGSGIFLAADAPPNAHAVQSERAEAEDRFAVLSRLMVPRVLAHPIDSVRAFVGSQAAAANRGWGHVQEFWNVRTSRIGGRVQAGIEGTLTRSTDAVAHRIVGALKDPDMPAVVVVRTATLLPPLPACLAVDQQPPACAPYVVTGAHCVANVCFSAGRVRPVGLA